MDNSLASNRNQHLITILRELRLRANLTQEELATRLDEPQSTVSKIETGIRRLDLVELEQVTKALNSSLREVIERFEDER